LYVIGLFEPSHSLDHGGMRVIPRCIERPVEITKQKTEAEDEQIGDEEQIRGRHRRMKA
jgi:hypothetical protein